MATIFDLGTKPTEKTKPTGTRRTIFDIGLKPTEIQPQRPTEVKPRRTIFNAGPTPPPGAPITPVTPTETRLFEKPTPEIEPIWTPPEKARGPGRVIPLLKKPGAKVEVPEEYKGLPRPDVWGGLKKTFGNTANMFNWILESRQYEAEYMDPFTGKPLKRPPDYSRKRQTQKEQIHLAWQAAKPELEAAVGRTSEAALGYGIAIIGLGAMSAVPNMWKYYTAKKIVERVPQNEVRTALARHFRPYSGAKRPPTTRDIAVKEWWESLDKVEQVEVMKTGQNIYYVPRAKGFVITSKTYPGQFYGPEAERLYLPTGTIKPTYELVKGHPLGKPAFSRPEILEKQRYQQWLKDRKVFIAPTEEVEVAAIAPEVGAISTEGLDVIKISTDQYLALKPTDMEDLYATYQEGFDKRAEPLKQRVETLGKEFEAAQPRGPERKRIKQEIEKTKKELVDIEGESTGRFFDAQLKLRDELEKRITERYELTGDTEIYEILDDFFTRTSEPGYLERYWQTPQNEILQQVLGEFVEDGKLIPKTKAGIEKAIFTPPPEVTKPPAVSPKVITEGRQPTLTKPEALEELQDSLRGEVEGLTERLVETPVGFGSTVSKEILPAKLINNVIKFHEAKALPENKGKRDATILKSLNLTEKDISHPAIEHDIHFHPEFFVTGKVYTDGGALSQSSYWEGYGGGEKDQYYFVYERQPNGDIAKSDIVLFQNDFYKGDEDASIPIVLGKKPPVAPPTEKPVVVPSGTFEKWGKEAKLATGIKEPWEVRRKEIQETGEFSHSGEYGYWKGMPTKYKVIKKKDRYWVQVYSENKTTGKFEEDMHSIHGSYEEAITELEQHHQEILQQAITAGKPVPPEVIADYPGLREAEPVGPPIEIPKYEPTKRAARVAPAEPKEGIEKVAFKDLKVGDVVTHREGANAAAKHNWTIHRIVKDKNGLPSRIFLRDRTGTLLKYAWSRLQWEEAIYRVGKTEVPKAPAAVAPSEKPLTKVVGLEELKNRIQRETGEPLTDIESEALDALPMGESAFIKDVVVTRTPDTLADFEIMDKEQYNVMLDGFMEKEGKEALKGETTLYQVVKKLGGIRSYRKGMPGALTEEYKVNVPVFLRNNNGLPLDEMASTLGTQYPQFGVETENELIAALRKEKTARINGVREEQGEYIAEKADKLIFGKKPSEIVQKTLFGPEEKVPAKVKPTKVTPGQPELPFGAKPKFEVPVAKPEVIYRPIPKGTENFHQRWDAAKEILNELKENGYKAEFNRGDATITIYHGTSTENAKKILKEGRFEEMSFFSHAKSKAAFGSMGAKGYGKEILSVKVDPRDISFNSGTGEIEAEEGLIRNPITSIWESPQRIKPTPEVKPKIAEAKAAKEHWQMTQEEFKKIPIIKYIEERLKDKTNPLKVSERNQLAEQLVDMGLMKVEDLNYMTERFGFGGKVAGIKNLSTKKPIPSKPVEGDMGKLLNYISQWQTFQNVPLFAHRRIIVKALQEGKPVPSSILESYRGWTDGRGDTGWADRELFKRKHKDVTLDRQEIKTATADKVKYIAKDKTGNVIAKAGIVPWNREGEAIKDIEQKLARLKIAEPTVALRSPTETEKLKSKVELIIKQKGIMYARDMKIETHKDVADIFYELKNADREKMFILNLDTDNKIINVENVSVGTLNANLFHPREALKNSILSKAKKVWFIHNHPSGDTSPSEDDLVCRLNLQRVANKFRIDVEGGVIIDRTEYYHFSDDEAKKYYYKIPEKLPKKVPLVEVEMKLKPSSLSNRKITGPEDVAEISKGLVYCEEPTFIALFLDIRNSLNASYMIGHSLENLMEIANSVIKNGILTNSSGVIISTNVDVLDKDISSKFKDLRKLVTDTGVIDFLDVVQADTKEAGKYVSLQEKEILPKARELRAKYRITPEQELMIREPAPAKIKVGELMDELQRGMEAGEFGERRALRKAFYVGKKTGKIEASMKYKDFLKKAKERKGLALESKKAIKYIGRLLKIKGIHYDYQPLIDAIKQKFEFIPRAKKTLFRRAETKKFVEREQEAGHPLDMPEKVLNLLDKTNVREMNAGELRGIKEEVQHIVHLGRFKNKLLKIRHQKDLDALANDIGNEITKGKPIMPAEIKIGVADEDLWIKKFHRSLMRQERQIEKIGGMGVNTRTFQSIWMPMDTAENLNIIGKNKRLDEIAAFINRNKLDIFKMKKDKIKISDRVSLTSNEKIWAYLSSFNENNLKHLMVGNGFTSKDIEDVKDSMTPLELKIANWMAKKMDQYEEINAIYRMIKGKDMKREDMYAPIIIDWEMAGIDYEPSIVEDILSRFSHRKVTLQKSFTKERVGGLQPVVLDAWGNFIRHIKAVERYKAYALTERDVGRIISHPQVKNAILQAYPKDGERLYKDLRQWFEDAIGNPTYMRRDPLSKRIQFARRNSALALLGGNLLTMLRQTISYSNATALVNPYWMTRGTAEFLTHPISIQAKVFEKAPQHRYRFVERDIAEQIERTGRKELMTKGQRFFAFFMRGIRFFDRKTVITSWWSAYKKELFRTGDEEKAIKVANFVVRRTQPMHRRIDLSALYRSREELTRAFTMFQNMPNQTYNFVVHDLWRAHRAGKISKWQLGMGFLFAIVAPSFLYSFSRRGRLPKPKEFVTDILLYPLITIPGARDVSFIVANILEGKRFYGTGLSLPPLLFAEAGTRMIAAKKPSTMLKYAIQTGAYYYGIPYAQPRRVLQGIIDLATGETKDLRRLIWSKWALEEKGKGKIPKLPSLPKIK